MDRSTGPIFIALAFFAVFAGKVSCDENVPVPVTLQLSKTTKIIGIEEQTAPGKNSRTFYSFLGIPYAETPARWTESKVSTLTKPEYDATKFGDFCVQWWQDVYGSEDCLYANVFTPKLPEEGKKNKLLPVMVYIHGGGYMLGSSNAVGGKILMKHDVVLVTFNYRMGVFGYLSTGDKNLPGNYGALDQVTLLDWVQKYIAKFGGDPKSVTVFGHSAGGAASHMLTLSPRAKGKLHKAILMSGTALGPWVLDKKPAEFASDYAKRVGCTQGIKTQELVECLKGKTTNELINIQKDTIDYWILPLTLQHVVDGQSRPAGEAFLPELPEKLLDGKKYDENVPIISGVVSAEGIMQYAFLHLAEEEFFDDPAHFRGAVVPRLVRSLLPFAHTEDDVARISAGVLKQYFPGDDKDLTEAAIVKGVVEIGGDAMFHKGHRETIHKYAEKGHKNVWAYVIAHRKKKSPCMTWNQLDQLKAKGIKLHPMVESGVSHVDDMYYFFDHCELFPSDPKYKTQDEDVKFSDFVTSVWVEFAKTGSPAEAIKKMKGYPEWEPVKSGSIKYYNLTSVSVPMGKEFQEKGSLFWTRALKSVDSARKVDEL